MTYLDLTNEDQDSLQEWLNTQLRIWAGEQARLNTRAAATNTLYNGQILNILGDLIGSDEVPNIIGLKGATALTKDEIVSIMSHIQTIVGTDGSGGLNTEAHRQLYGKAIGGVNLTR